MYLIQTGNRYEFSIRIITDDKWQNIVNSPFHICRDEYPYNLV